MRGHQVVAPEQVIDVHKKNGTLFSTNQGMLILRHVVKGLHFLHSNNIVHR